MRLVACLTVCVIPLVANAAQTESQPPSDPQAYCVNRGADFYPYTGEPCKAAINWVLVTVERLVAIGLQCLGNSVLRWPALSNCRSNTDGSGSLCRFREDGNSSFTSAPASTSACSSTACRCKSASRSALSRCLLRSGSGNMSRKADERCRAMGVAAAGGSAAGAGGPASKCHYRRA